MRISADGSDLKRLQADLRAYGKQAAFAQVVALTRTGGRVKEAQRHEMRDSFDRVTPYALNAVYLRPATRPNPEAIVQLKDDGSSSNQGIAPTRFLGPEIQGGSRSITRFESSLQRSGHMPRGWHAVPGKFARLDAYGNLSRGQIIQILSQLRVTLVKGFDRNLPRRDGTKKTEAKIQRAFKRAGGQYFAVTGLNEGRGRGNLRPGIYQARDTAFGRADPRPVVIFVQRVHYQRRFDWDGTAEFAIQRHWQPELTAALRQYAPFGKT